MNKTLIFAGLFGFLSIMLGAYVEHEMKGLVSLSEYRGLSQALKYQMLHSVVLLAVGLAISSLNNNQAVVRFLPYIATSFIIGVILFSFTIYAEIIFKIAGATELTPIGGVILMFSWFMVFILGFVGRKA